MVCLCGYLIVCLNLTPSPCSLPARYGWKNDSISEPFLLTSMSSGEKILSGPFQSSRQNDRLAQMKELDPTLITFLELPETGKYKI